MLSEMELKTVFKDFLCSHNDWKIAYDASWLYLLRVEDNLFNQYMIKVSLVIAWWRG